MKTLVVLSGGMDSAALLAKCVTENDLVRAISFDYGQRHKKELTFAAALCSFYGVGHSVVRLHDLVGLLPGNALTDADVAVPHGHYAAPTMIHTVVPNRNAIMLAIAFGAAAANQLDNVAIAVHAGDHAIYPDCRPEFIDAFRAMEVHALEGVGRVELLAPFVMMTKTQIAALGDSYDVPWTKTWSCYEGGEKHCGRCGTCVERREAFAESGVADPTEYAA